MIYHLKVTANSKRFGELIERNNYYSEVYTNLDQAVNEGKIWIRNRIIFLNSQSSNSLTLDNFQENKNIEYSFTVTELDLDYIDKFNNIKEEEKENFIEPNDRIYKYNINGDLINIDLAYRGTNGERLIFKSFEQNKKKTVKKKLTNKYTFDNFIITDNNSFAYEAALAVSEYCGKMYNPLFLYGNNGREKTHLINAIENKILVNNPNTKILHITSEELKNELVFNIKNDKIESFRIKYKNIDVLMIEDIQFIVGKRRVEEEILHILKYLHENEKQIIIFSDIEASKLDIESSDLKAILESGLFAEISK